MQDKNIKKGDLFEFNKERVYETTTVVAPHTSVFKDVLKKFFNNKLAVIGLVLFVGIILCAIIIPFFSQDPLIRNSSNTHSSPSSNHWMGTDLYGRDIWSRVWNGLAFSLLLAFTTTTINIFIGILIGVISGYFSSFDRIFKNIIKIFYALPPVLIMVVFSASFGASFGIMVASLVFSGWVQSSQMIRANTLRIKELDYVTASKTMGTKKVGILTTFFVNSLPIIITEFVSTFPIMILNEAFLGFVGLSIPDIATLGNVINDGRSFLLTYPLETVFPLIILVLSTVSIQLVGFGVEDSLRSIGGKK